ncbi:MAG: hypothetical protein ACE5IR_04355 [bacterium]
MKRAQKKIGNADNMPSFRYNRCIFYVVLLFITVFIPAKVDSQIVVVVPSKSKIDSLSFKDLQKIFDGQKVDAIGENPCQIVEFAQSSDAFYKKLYNLDAYAVGKHWLRLIFSGERVLPPKNFTRIDKFLKYFIEQENSIGFLSAEAFEKVKNNSLRAVVIEGLNYQHTHYVLRKNIKQKNR